MAISLENISLSFSGKTILDSFSLALPSKGAVCFFGPSGCGKTTLFRLIAGLLSPDSGTINGLDKMKISYVFQENRLLPWLTAEQNIRVVQQSSASFAPSYYLAQMGLSGTEQLYPSELSGGMNRRLAIARALAVPFDLLLLDEPFTGLDEKSKQQVCDAIFPVYRDRLILFTTHDREDARRLSDQLFWLQGPPLQML